MPFYLGIDGGGSKTSCLIGDEHAVLGTGTAAGSNVVRVGEAKAREALAAAIRQACAAAGISPIEVSRTCIGVAGAARPQISAAIRRLISEIVPGEIEVVGDMIVALEAAFGGSPGVVVIAGTGSIAYGADTHGKTARAGGWGFAISDEGSGHWIGRAAISAAMRACDENEANPPLLAHIMKCWYVQTHEQLVLAANASPPPDFARLFPAVLSAADSGDPVARDVLARAGRELASLAATVIRRLFPEAGAVQVAMSGGVFGNSPLIRDVFYNSLRPEFPECTVSTTVAEPVKGALALARKGRRV